MRSVRFEPKAFEHVAYWLNANPKLVKRATELLKECQRTPFEGKGKPEPLKGALKGYWSRRLDEEHRLVYEVTDKEIVVHSLKGHYE